MTLKNKYPKGSEWGKWDLHIHTPCSIVQEYGGNYKAFYKKHEINVDGKNKIQAR